MADIKQDILIDLSKVKTHLSKVESNKALLTPEQLDKFHLYSGHSQMMSGLYDDALNSFDKILATSQDNNYQARAKVLKGVVQASQGQYIDAFVNIEAANGMLSELSDNLARKDVLVNIVNVYVSTGLIDKAYPYSKHLLKVIIPEQDPKDYCFAYYNAGKIELLMEKYDVARHNFSIAKKNCQLAEQKLYQYYLVEESARISLHDNDPNTAYNLVKNKLKDIETFGWDMLISSFHITLSEMALEKKAVEESVGLGEKGYKLAKKLNYLPLIKESARVLAKAYSQRENEKKAVEYYQEYIDAERKFKIQMRQRKLAYYMAKNQG
ncbi:MAG: hypothetical protein HWD86_05355 [Kangiellaceae bacterium]|nr:hypothetical protein [Kangiellaceae bacterium]